MLKTLVTFITTALCSISFGAFSEVSSDASASSTYRTPVAKILNRKLMATTDKKVFGHASPPSKFTAAERTLLVESGLSKQLIMYIELLHQKISKKSFKNEADILRYFSVGDLKILPNEYVRRLSKQLQFAKLRALNKRRATPLSKAPFIVSPLVRLAASFSADEREHLPCTRSKYKDITEKLALVGKEIKTLQAADSLATETSYIGDDVVSDRLHRIRSEMESRTDLDTKASESEEDFWAEFLAYFKQRTDELDSLDGDGDKISKEEISKVFHDTVESHYTCITIDDCDVYVSTKTLDLGRIHAGADWKNNLDVMKEGRNPIGPDGKPMNLHHLTRTHPGALIMVTESFHQAYNTLLHLRSERWMVQPKRLDRRTFSQWKSLALEALGTQLAKDAAGVMVTRRLFDAETVGTE